MTAGAVSTLAFVLFEERWPDGTVTMHLQLGTSGRLTDGSASWGDSAESALAAWNQSISRVQFRVVRDSAAPRGDGNGVNNVFFSNDVYGMAFNTGVLAVTTDWVRRRTTHVEADVIFNSADTWDSYTGELKRGTQDFHRVALHEFGHVLGLDHPDEYGQTVTAIMNSHFNSLDHLADDDIAGARALYGATGGGSTSGGAGTVSLPPGDELLDFRNQLESKHRAGLKRSATSTSVDTEGDVVWMREYLRYRLNGCGHAVAVQNVFVQIDGRAAPAVCR